MNYSENVLEQLMTRSERDKSNLLEAAVDYCVEHDLDEADFLQSLDENTRLMLRKSAIDHRKVRGVFRTSSHALEWT